MRQLVISKSITHRDHRSLDSYFNEVDKIDLINLEEEVMLTRLVRDGDQLALERLTKTNLRFVISVAKQYLNQGIALGDLINEGNMGLITAAKRYDETKGFKFISYAVWWIRQAIIAAIASQSRMVRMPYNKVVLLNKINRSFSELEQLYNRKPTSGELAEYLEIPIENVLELLNNSAPCLSLDEPTTQDEQQKLIDILFDVEAKADDVLMRESILKEVEFSFRILTEREREILILFFGLGQFPPLPMDEIAERFNITTSGARRVKNTALFKLRNGRNAPALMMCLS